MVFVNIVCVVRDLISMLCDREIKISEVQSTSDQRLKSQVTIGLQTEIMYVDMYF